MDVDIERVQELMKQNKLNEGQLQRLFASRRGWFETREENLVI